MSAFLPLAFDQSLIFWPFAALMLLTLAVWLYMYARRLTYMAANGIDPQRLASPEGKAQALSEEVERPANNLKNLFELPVLFYALCLALHTLGQVDLLYVQLAWAYAGLRAAHSFVHCTFNHVKTRFAFYFLSSLVLWVMLTRFALGL